MTELAVGEGRPSPGSAQPPDAGRRARVRTVFLGSGGFGRPILEALTSHPAIDIVAVVTAPPRPVGRRQVPTPTPVDIAAREHGLDVRSPARLRDPDAIADILGLEPGLLVLADYGQIVPAELLGLAHGALNLHPSLLPRHRGATPIPAAILDADIETGVSLMRMDAGLDTGPIVAVERVPLAGDETAPALEARLAIVAAGLLARSLHRWLAGELVPTPQSEAGATLTRPLRRRDGRLDPRLPAAVLERQVRAHLPWPGSFVEIGGERLVILAAAATDGDAADAPGLLVADAHGLALATGTGRLRLVEVQPAGGRPMTGEAWVRGRPAVLGRSIDVVGPDDGSARDGLVSATEAAAPTAPSGGPLLPPG